MNQINSFLLISLVFLLSVSLVSADSGKFSVNLVGDDYYYNSNIGDVTGTNTVIEEINNVVSPSLTNDIVMYINTSTIPDDAVIDSINVVWYVDSYTASKGVAKTYTVSTLGQQIYSGTYSSAGWVNATVNNTYLQYLNLTYGMNKIDFGLSDPGSGKARGLAIRSKENTFGLFASYMNISYTLPSHTINLTFPLNNSNIEITWGLLGNYYNGIYNFSFYNPTNDTYYCGLVVNDNYKGGGGIQYNCSQVLCEDVDAIFGSFDYCADYDTIDCYDSHNDDATCLGSFGCDYSTSPRSPLPQVNINKSGNYSLGYDTGDGFFGVYDYTFNNTGWYNWTINCTQVSGFETLNTYVSNDLWWFYLYNLTISDVTTPTVKHGIYPLIMMVGIISIAINSKKRMGDDDE